MTQVPKNRTDLLPHYSRLVSTLNKYMPDVGSEIVASVSASGILTVWAKVLPFISLMKNFVICKGRKTWWKSLRKSDWRCVSHMRGITSAERQSMQNILFLSNLTKFRVVPSHVILHMFKVCLDDFSGTNVENIALLLEGCGRFLLRSEETSERFSTMVKGHY